MKNNPLFILVNERRVWVTNGSSHRTDELISQLQHLDAQRVVVTQELKKLRMEHHALVLGALHAGRAPWEIKTPA